VSSGRGGQKALLLIGVLVILAVIGNQMSKSSDDSGSGGTTAATYTTTTYRRSTTPSSTGQVASPGLTTVQASDFSVSYPTGWTVEKKDVVPAGTNYKDTTIKRDISDPHYVVRVDVLPGGSVGQVADNVVAGLAKNPSFRQIDRRSISFTTASGTYSAVYLEFLLNHTDTGVPMHTVDVLFNDSRGRNFAVLTRAPESDYATHASLFGRVRSSIAPR
jgi:hypothetical protein